MSRIGFFAGLPFHRPILAPVRDAIAGHETLLGADRRAMVRFAPDVLVVADATDLEFFRRRLPRTWLGSVRHGMIGKRGFERLPPRAQARRFDFLCVGDGFSSDRYQRAGAEPGGYWLTGYPQLDPLFRHDPPPDLGLDPTLPTVLYAPTWNLGLSSAPLLGERLVELVRGDGPRLNLIIKPHPAIAMRRPKWLRWWRGMARNDTGVRLIGEPDADVTAAMLAADLLISDASSVTYEFLALDRPIVLVTNPRHRHDPAYDPEDIVWRWRDLGDEVTDPARLATSVAAALADPGRHAAKRAAYADELFGAHRDGQNHVRIATRVAELASSGPRPVDAFGATLDRGRGAAFASWRRNARVRIGRSDHASRTVLAWMETARLDLRAARG
jgi:hypothetical protein